MDYLSFYTAVQKDKREKEIVPQKLHFILSSIGTGKRVLDVGCNDGYTASFIIKQQNEVYGVDIGKSDLMIAKKRGLKVKVCDITKGKLPYPKNYFDVVLLGDVIEHVFDTDMLLKNIYDVLKPGGFLLLTTPNVASIGRRLMLLFGHSPYLEYSPHHLTNDLPSVGHIRYYTKNILKNQLQINRYTRIQIIGDKINFGMLSLPSLGKSFPQFAPFLFAKAYK
jgi:2-polyprenyl-3-methyl-5-hydroxy-6-metoxy-1,4-benzoquinol methylase